MSSVSLSFCLLLPKLLHLQNPDLALMALRTHIVRNRDTVASGFEPAAPHCPLTILFLHAEVPSGPPTFPGDGDNGYQFEYLFNESFASCGPSPHYDGVVMKTYQVMGDTWVYPDANELDGAAAILIGGSGKSRLPIRVLIDLAEHQISPQAALSGKTSLGSNRSSPSYGM